MSTESISQDTVVSRIRSSTDSVTCEKGEAAATTGLRTRSGLILRLNKGRRDLALASFTVAIYQQDDPLHAGSHERTYFSILWKLKICALIQSRATRLGFPFIASSSSF